MAETIRDLVVSLSLDSDNFSRNMRSINQQIREAESTFNLAGAGVKNFDSTVAGTQAKLTMLGSKLTSQNRAVEQYSRTLVQANQKLTESHARQQKLTESLSTAKQRMEQAKSAVTSAAAEYKRLASTLGESDSATIAAKENLDSCKDEYKAAREEVKGLEAQLKSNAKVMQNNADAVTKATTNLNNAKAGVRATEAEIRALSEELNRMQSRWTQAGDALIKFSQQCQSIAQTLSKVGTFLTASLTTPIAGLGVSAVKASVDFESAFAGVRKTVDASEEDYQRLSNSVKQMSTEIATSTTEISDVMANAGQLGIQTENLEEFTRTMIDLGNSTDVSASDAATAIAQFANVTNMSQQDFSNYGSALVDLGNNYATTESAIMNMASGLAAVGSQVGLNQAQILGFATALSSVGLEAQAGGTAFSKAMVQMQVAVETGNDSLADFAKVAGTTTEGFKELWNANPAEAIEQFIVGLSKMDEEGISAIVTLDEMGFKEVRLRDTLLRATNATELFSKTQKTAANAWKENTALSDEAGKRYSTTASKLENLKNSATLAAQQIGDDLNPMVQGLIEKGNDLMASFMNLDAGQRKTIIGFAGVAAAAGPAALAIGKGTEAVAKISEKLGKGMQMLGKFSCAIQSAGGGFTGLIKTLASSKFAVAALSVALAYGVYKLLDYATGAKATREALEGMVETADKWKNTAAETFYGSSQGLEAFGMSKEHFAEPPMGGQEWVDGLIEVWTDGQKETDEIVEQWTGSFHKLTEGTRSELKQLQQSAEAGGYTGLTEQIQTDIETLDSMNEEIDSLLKKRQNGLLTDDEKLRLQELIDTREKLIIKYQLEPDDASGFDTIQNKVKAAEARAKARGQEVDPSLYQDAIVAAAEGMAAMNQQIDEQYDKEYAVIQLIEDEGERNKALEELNTKYNEQKLAAAREYAETLQGVVMPVWNTPEIQEADKNIDTLTQKLRDYSTAQEKGDEQGMSKALQEMNELTAGMDEGALTEYVGMLTQIQSLLDSGMSEEEVQAMFPEIDFSGQMNQIAQLATFVEEHKDSLEGLSGIFGEALPEEILKITTDLEMTRAKQRWAEFAADPGASITTDAVVQNYNDSQAAMALQPKVNGLVNKYTEKEGGADKASLTPEGIIAYVSAYSEATTGASIDDLTPENVTALVNAYHEATDGVDITQLTPEEITARVSQYLEADGVNLDDLKPSTITAFVMAYEEIEGGASTTGLKEPAVAAMITAYADGDNIDLTKLTKPQIEGLVSSFAEATGCDKTKLLEALEAKITKYTDEGATKPTFVEVEGRISLTGLESETLAQFKKDHPVELTGTVRLGEAYENPEDVLNDPIAKFYMNGEEIPVNLVPANLIDADTLMAYDADGTLHVLLTPEIDTPEAVEQANEIANSSALDGTFLEPLEANTNKDVDAVLGTLESIVALKERIAELNAEGDDAGDLKFDLSNLGKGGGLGTIQETLGRLDETDLSNISNQIAALMANLLNPDLDEGTAEEYRAQLQGLLDVVGAADQYLGTGNDVSEGIAQGMKDYGWEGDASTLATSIQTAINNSLGAHSPATATIPTGTDVAEGIAEGMKTYDFGADASTVTTNIVSAFNGAVAGGSFTSVGAAIMQAINAGMSGGGEEGGGDGTSDVAAVVMGIANSLQTLVAQYLSESTLKTAGTAAMRGLASGITTGKSGVTSALTKAFSGLDSAAVAEGISTAMDGVDMDTPISLLSDKVKTAGATYFTGTTLRSAGLNVMRGLVAGINSGRAGVVTAMRNAAKAAVKAAKDELEIESPSRVFRDEVGVMAMKGFGEGALRESKAQTRTIRNAMRYLTDEAGAGVMSFGHSDNRRTYNQQSSVNLTGNTFNVRSEEDIRSLAIEISTLTRQQQRGRGLGKA